MDELRPIRDFRTSVTVPAAARDAARARLVARLEGRRPPLRQRRRRLVVALATLLVAAVAAGTATGLGDWLLDTVRGKPAPRSIQEAFGRYDDDRDRLVPIFENRTGVIPTRARGVVAVRTSGGVLALWAAPTRSGGECFELTWFNPDAKGFLATPPIFGGCAQPGALGRRKVVAMIGSTGTFSSGNPPEVKYLIGQAAPGVRSVELESAGRALRRVRVFDGYILTDVTGGLAVDAVVALDAGGRPVGRHSLTDQPVPPPSPPEPEPVGEPRRLARIRTQGRVFTLDVMRSTGEGRCFELRVEPGEILSPLHCPLLPEEPLGTVSPLEHAVPGPPYALLVGEVRPVVRSVELRYEDGTTDAVPLRDGLVLFVVPREHHVRGRRVALLVARDAEGRVVDRRRLDRRR